MDWNKNNSLHQKEQQEYDNHSENHLFRPSRHYTKRNTIKNQQQLNNNTSDTTNVTPNTTATVPATTVTNSMESTSSNVNSIPMTSSDKVLKPNHIPSTSKTTPNKEPDHAMAIVNKLIAHKRSLARHE